MRYSRCWPNSSVYIVTVENITRSWHGSGKPSTAVDYSRMLQRTVRSTPGTENTSPEHFYSTIQVVKIDFPKADATHSTQPHILECSVSLPSGVIRSLVAFI